MRINGSALLPRGYSAACVTSGSASWSLTGIPRSSLSPHRLSAEWATILPCRQQPAGDELWERIMEGRAPPTACSRPHLDHPPDRGQGCSPNHANMEEQTNPFELALGTASSIWRWRPSSRQSRRCAAIRGQGRRPDAGGPLPSTPTPCPAPTPSSGRSSRTRPRVGQFTSGGAIPCPAGQEQSRWRWSNADHAAPARACRFWSDNLMVTANRGRAPFLCGRQEIARNTGAGAVALTRRRRSAKWPETPPHHRTTKRPVGCPAGRLAVGGRGQRIDAMGNRAAGSKAVCDVAVLRNIRA